MVHSRTMELPDPPEASIHTTCYSSLKLKSSMIQMIKQLLKRNFLELAYPFLNSNKITHKRQISKKSKTSSIPLNQSEYKSGEKPKNIPENTPKNPPEYPTENTPENTPENKPENTPKNLNNASNPPINLIQMKSAQHRKTPTRRKTHYSTLLLIYVLLSSNQLTTLAVKSPSSIFFSYSPVKSANFRQSRNSNNFKEQFSANQLGRYKTPVLQNDESESNPLKNPPNSENSQGPTTKNLNSLKQRISDKQRFHSCVHQEPYFNALLRSKIVFWGTCVDQEIIDTKDNGNVVCKMDVWGFFKGKHDLLGTDLMKRVCDKSTRPLKYRHKFRLSLGNIGNNTICNSYIPTGATRIFTVRKNEAGDGLVLDSCD